MAIERNASNSRTANQQLTFVVTCRAADKRVVRKHVEVADDFTRSGLRTIALVMKHKLPTAIRAIVRHPQPYDATKLHAIAKTA